MQPLAELLAAIGPVERGIGPFYTRASIPIHEEP